MTANKETENTHPLIVASEKRVRVDTGIHVALSLFFLIYFVGIVLFHYLEGWNYLDSAYFITATVLTIGYGDIVPHTDLGKVATIFYAWLGIGVGFYIIMRISNLRRKYLDAYLERFERVLERKYKH